MHELLRDAERVSMRLVMTPDRMVVAEAMRTFTYLNLYGYLTDAVVVNRVFPDEVDGTYFGAWRAVQAGAARARRVRLRARAGAARAVLRRARCSAREMLDRLGEALFAGRDAGAVLHDRVTQELSLHDGGAELRLDLPFVEQGRRVAEEDRARARRARRRPQAHDRAAGRDGGLPADLGDARGRLAASSGSPSRSRPVPEDPLEAVREAERLVREATERAERLARRGAAARLREPPGASGRGRRAAFPDLSALTGLRRAARSSLPPELQRQLAEALRELLIALRAVLDYSIDRLEPGPAPPSATVEDIPIS